MVEDDDPNAPVPPLPPPPKNADTVVPEDVSEAWRVRDAMLILVLGDAVAADREFERVRTRKTRRRKT
jgi:hypothetical protein